MKKKLLSLLLVLFMLLSVASINAEGKKTKVIATTFPSYDWTKNLLQGLEEEFDLQLLQDKGVDLHNYQPTAQDFMKLAKADMLIHVGGVSDSWVSKAMQQAENKNLKLLSLVDAIGDSTKNEKMVEGMQEAPHAHSHEEHSDEKHTDANHHEEDKHYEKHDEHKSEEHAEQKHDEHSEHNHNEHHDHEHKEVSSLEGWQGSWNSYLSYFEDEKLMEVLKNKAEAGNTTVEKLMERLKAQLDTEFAGMKVEGDKLSFFDKFEMMGGKEIAKTEYKFVKTHKLKLGEHEIEWHEFRAEGEAKYQSLLLTEVHSHGEGSLSHFHLRYGNNVEELLNNDKWWPTFVSGSTTAEKIVESMTHNEKKHDERNEHANHNHDEHHDHEHADHNHNEQHKHEHDEHEHTHVDEHVWLSIKNSIKIVEKIADSLIELRPDLKEKILANKESYIKKLSELDEKYEKELSKLENKSVIVADRFPFVYLMEDYGIKYYAAFSGCAAEAEASFETIKFLAQKADEINAKSLFVLEGSNKGIAEAVNKASKNPNREINVLNSIQTTSMEEINAGASYLNIMEQNLEQLLKALK